MRILLFGLMLGCLSGCVESPTNSNVSSYLDLDSVLRQQIVRLTGKGVQLEKTVTLGDSSATRRLAGDSVALSAELEIFKKINPNQTKYLNAFSVEHEELMEKYVKLDSSGELQGLEIERGSGGLIGSIRGVAREKASIYTSYREMELQFRSGDLVSWSVEGYQKMIFTDTVFFTVKARVMAVP